MEAVGEQHGGFLFHKTWTICCSKKLSGPIVNGYWTSWVEQDIQYLKGDEIRKQVGYWITWQCLTLVGFSFFFVCFFLPIWSNMIPFALVIWDTKMRWVKTDGDPRDVSEVIPWFFDWHLTVRRWLAGSQFDHFSGPSTLQFWLFAFHILNHPPKR